MAVLGLLQPPPPTHLPRFPRALFLCPCARDCEESAKAAGAGRSPATCRHDFTRLTHMYVRVRWNSACKVEAGFECKEVADSEKRASESSHITGVFSMCASAIACVQCMAVQQRRPGCGDKRESAPCAARMGTGFDGLSKLRQRPFLLSCVHALSCIHVFMRTRV